MSCIRYEAVYRTRTVYDLVVEPAWDGSAVAQSLLRRDGLMQFWVPRSAPGVVVGMALDPGGEFYGDIDAGVLFNNGTAYPVIGGEEQIAIGSVDHAVYSFLRYNGVVYFFGSDEDEWVEHPSFPLPVPGEILYTFPGAIPAPVSFKAYLYSVADTLKGGVVTPWDGRGGVEFAPLGIDGAGAVTSGDGSVTIQYAVLGAETGVEYAQGVARAAYLWAQGFGYDPGGSGSASLVVMHTSGEGIVETSGAASLRAPEVVGADYAYAYGEIVFRPTAGGRESAGFQMDYTAGAAFLAEPRAGGFEDAVSADSDVHFPALDAIGAESGVEYAQGAVTFMAAEAVGDGAVIPDNYLSFSLYNLVMRGEPLTANQRETFARGVVGVDRRGTIGVQQRLLTAGETGVATFYNPTQLVEDVLAAQVRGSVVQVAAELLEGLTADGLDAVAALNVAEVLYARGEVQTFYQGFVEAVLAARALLQSPEGGLYTQNIVLDATAEDAHLAAQVAQLADEVLGTLDQEYRGVFVVNEELVAEADDLVEAISKLLHQGVLETGAWLGLRLSGEVHTAWAMNLEGSMPVSQYENFDFNSFAEVGGEYFAANEEGIFRLGADSDAGAPIDAAVGSMLLDLGTSRQKRVQAAYIGYTASGRVVLKVRSEDDGQVVEDWFEAQQQTAAAPRNQMVRIGRGLRSRYWQFELVNVDGADFELDSFEMYPIPLNRRV